MVTSDQGEPSKRPFGALGERNSASADALLVALTLSPSTYSRNRFFEMYRSKEMALVRRRAGQLRGIVTALVSDVRAHGAGKVVSIETASDGASILIYEVPAIGLRRTLVLKPIEMTLLRYCLSKAPESRTPVELVASPEDGDRIARALLALSPVPLFSLEPSDL